MNYKKRESSSFPGSLKCKSHQNALINKKCEPIDELG
ncbi:hypothetical protein Pan161_48020 [Gimesia algae]|uniref:Uncharacterized protein n=1 Tax=Gimesia algae TaxID=2527971 RepID=A0A517VJF4_9PLAN|nr:hypothetical protein Pan161_48020 [Gimesia algae]